MVVRQANSRRAWFGGRLLRVGTGTVNADRLGTYQGTYPYGELQGAVGTPGEKFATYWRDATGLDYAVNRYYSSQMGRFLSADPYQASGGAANPGSWNRYAYVEGDPVNWSDHQGLQRDVCEDPVEARLNSTCVERSKNGGRWATFLVGGGFYDAWERDVVMFKTVWVSIGSSSGGSRSGGSWTPFGYNGARNALAKKDCYEHFGFSSATAAQEAFATVNFKVAYLGPLQVQVFPDGAMSVVGGTPPPAQTELNTVSINYNYAWYDFASVEARDVVTGSTVIANYLGMMNNELGRNMTTSDLSGLILLHEFSHTKLGGDRPQETSNRDFNQSIFDKCFK